MRRLRRPLVLIACLFFSVSSFATWYEDYDAGIAAAKRRDWSTVISRMDAALRVKPGQDL